MKVDKYGFAVVGGIADETGRYALDCVAVEPDGTTVASNGRFLVAVQGKDAGPEERTLLLPCEVAAAVKTMNGGKRGLEESAEVTLTEKLFRVAGPKSAVEVPNACPDRGTFPDWRGMAPTAALTDRRIYLSAGYLRQLVTVLDKLVSEENTAVEVTIPDNTDKAVAFRGYVGGTSERQFFAVLAPIRVKEAGSETTGAMKRNDWIDELSPAAEEPEE